MAQQASRGKKTKRPDNRPARARYWSSGRLRKKKIKNMLANGKTQAEANAIWEARKHRKR